MTFLKGSSNNSGQHTDILAAIKREINIRSLEDAL